MTEEVVLVTEDDRVVGREEKGKAHREGRLHRAISVCLFDKEGRWLLQRRSPMKYHSPGKWSNTCCGHPRPGETPLQAASRRLSEELGVSCPLSFCLSFVYKVDVGGGMIEHEFDHLFTGTFEGPVIPNPDEVEEAAWWTEAEIKKSLEEAPQLFTPWFPLIYNIIDTTRPDRSKAAN